MAGIARITIPLHPEEVTLESIYPYLNGVFEKFTEQRIKIRVDYNIYCLEHDIRSKVRPHDNDNNNIVKAPHIRAMVDWKTGYVLGNDIKYAQSKDTQTDDITILNKYLRNSKKGSVDTDVAKWTYATGIGYYFIQPKKEFNIEYEAPFDIYAMESDSCCKVYSSFLGNEPLFDFLYTTFDKIDEAGNTTTYHQYSIYLKDKMHVMESKDGSTELTENPYYRQDRLVYQMLPLVEKRLNKDGIGLVAIARQLQNAIDKISSDSIDNISDIVNEVWFFLNTSLGETEDQKTKNLKNMKERGAVELFTENPDMPADVKNLKTNLDLTNTMQVRQILLREMYDICGVPIASNDISSGNVTKGGGEVANGYENAYNRALDDIKSFIKADTDVLERILFILRSISKSGLNELYPSEIEIKYCLNMTDNILSKTQSYVNLVTNNVPPALALEKVKMSSDPEAEGITIENYRKQLQAENKSETAANSQQDNINAE